MRRADLVLWMLIYPWSTLTAGLLAGLASYLLGRPRKVESSRGELAVEAWRIAAILAGLPAFFLAAELVLWIFDLEFRAPLAFTGLTWAAGAWLLGLAPLPLLAAWVRFRPLAGRPIRLALTLAGLGLLGMWLGPWAGHRAWSAQVARAASDPLALEQLVLLKAHRYVPAAEAEAALDRLLPGPEAVLALAEAQSTRFDRDLREYLAERIEDDLASAALASAERAAPLLWTLTDDPARTLRGYALTVPSLRPAALAAPPELGALALQPIGRQALAEGKGPAREALMAALLPALHGRALEPETVASLAAALDEGGSVGGDALAVLLRDGSREALRVALPRFVDADGRRAGYEGPDWAVLRRDCMARTASLVALQTDPDPRVAAGAGEVFKYVRQYCGKRWR